MTLNGVVAVTLRYFTEFGKLALQKTICGGIYARVYCIFSACATSSQRKFTFAISSPDEFLVYLSYMARPREPYVFWLDRVCIPCGTVKKLLLRAEAVSIGNNIQPNGILLFDLTLLSSNMFFDENLSQPSFLK